MATKVLVVDDDALVRRSVKFRLEQEGYSVVSAKNGEDALSFARRDCPDLVLLDIGLPDRDGLDVARTLRREMNVPIIFLTGRGQETDIVVGLELGAEDYITKPFGMRELLARIRVVLRRTERAPTSTGDEILHIGEVVLNPKSRKVNVRGKDVHLRPKEFEILRLLMANAGTVLTTDYLLDAVWGEEFAGAVQVLYVYMGWLRERIEEAPRRPCYIQTVRGVGYMFAGEEAEK
jgi:two-component system, OmpR family, alkaline phosphatase synthesis response regulator PhoP